MENEKHRKFYEKYNIDEEVYNRDAQFCKNLYSSLQDKLRKYGTLITIKDTTHFSCTDLWYLSPLMFDIMNGILLTDKKNPQNKNTAIINSVIIDFLDYHLKNENTMFTTNTSMFNELVFEKL